MLGQTTVHCVGLANSLTVYTLSAALTHPLRLVGCKTKGYVLLANLLAHSPSCAASSVLYNEHL